MLTVVMFILRESSGSPKYVPPRFCRPHYRLSPGATLVPPPAHQSPGKAISRHIPYSAPHPMPAHLHPFITPPPPPQPQLPLQQQQQMAPIVSSSASAASQQHYYMPINTECAHPPWHYVYPLSINNLH